MVYDFLEYSWTIREYSARVVRSQTSCPRPDNGSVATLVFYYYQMAELNLALHKKKDARSLIYKGKFPDVAGTQVDRSSGRPYPPPNIPTSNFL